MFSNTSRMGVALFARGGRHGYYLTIGSYVKWTLTKLDQHLENWGMFWSASTMNQVPKAFHHFRKGWSGNKVVIHTIPTRAESEVRSGRSYMKAYKWPPPHLAHIHSRYSTDFEREPFGNTAQRTLDPVLSFAGDPGVALPKLSTWATDTIHYIILELPNRGNYTKLLFLELLLPQVSRLQDSDFGNGGSALFNTPGRFPSGSNRGISPNWGLWNDWKHAHLCSCGNWWKYWLYVLVSADRWDETWSSWLMIWIVGLILTPLLFSAGSSTRTKEGISLFPPLPM